MRSPSNSESRSVTRVCGSAPRVGPYAAIGSWSVWERGLSRSSTRARNLRSAATWRSSRSGPSWQTGPTSSAGSRPRRTWSPASSTRYIVPLYDYWREPTVRPTSSCASCAAAASRSSLRQGPWDLDRAVRIVDQIDQRLRRRPRARHRPSRRQAGQHPPRRRGQRLPHRLRHRPGCGGAAPTRRRRCRSAPPPTPRPSRCSRAGRAAGRRLRPGVVVYEMLTGRLPFPDTQSGGATARQLHDPIPPVRSTRTDLPPASTTSSSRRRPRAPPTASRRSRVRRRLR